MCGGRHLHTLWILLCGAMQEHVSFIRQVHVDAVGSEVIGHGQLVVAMVAHLLHDLRNHTEKRQDGKWTLDRGLGST